MNRPSGPPAEVSYTAFLEGSLTLSRYGEWWQNGRPFQNKKLSDLFSRSVQWDPADSRYYVRIGAQRASFTVEDTAYFVTAFDTTTLPWQILLSDGTQELFDPRCLSMGDENQFYFLVKGGHRARALRPVHQQLLGFAVSDSELEIAGTRVPLFPKIG